MVIIIRLPQVSDDTDVFPIMNILVISDEQKAAVRGLWHQASLTDTAVCLEPCSNVKIIVHHSSSMLDTVKLLRYWRCYARNVFLWTGGTLNW